MQIPHALEKHGARHDLARPTHEVFEQLKFLGRELDAAVAARHAAREEIELEICDLQIRVSSFGVLARRRSASIRASNSENANGFVR